MVGLEENAFKSCIKRKVKFTASTFVKFLITGTVALSLTACGGGGGGGGSSSSGGNTGGTIEKPLTENTQNSQETLVTENETFKNKGNVDLTGNKTEDSVVGIVGKNSNILNEAEIKINDISSNNSKLLLASETGKTVLEELKKKGESFAIFSERGKVTNAETGKLIIKGDSVHGIFGLYSEITNNGVIQTDGEKSKDVTGISSLGGNVTNNNLINIVSEDAVGIRVHNNTTLTGIVELEKNNGITVTNNGTIKVTGESAEGIEGNGSKINIVNNTNGLIEITNKVITGKQDRINTYGINIDSDDDVPRSSNNTVTNKGKIKINFESTTLSSEKWFNTYGIGVDTDNSTITNDGTIEINAKYGSNKVNSTVAGMRADGTNNALINNKDIIITAKAEKVPSVNENPEDNSEVYLNGILVDEIEDTQIGRPDSEKVTIENNGNIIINSENMTALQGETNGILVRGDITDISILNTGKIEITNGKNTTGISAQGDNINIKNKGDIILSGTNGVIGIHGIGENWFTGTNSIGKIDIINDGNITITNIDKEFKNYDQITGIEGTGEKTIITNNKKINLIGANAIGIVVENGARATNNGNIVITSKYFDFPDSMSLGEAMAKSSKGVAVYGGTAVNSENGKITVTGSSIGMYAANGFNEIDTYKGEAINKGKIELLGETTIDKVGSIGMGAISGANAVNEKDIISTGKLSNAFGMITLAGKIENKGKIELSGEHLTGMSAILDKNVTTSNITNKGKINLSGTGDIIGIGATHITNIDEESPVQEKNIVNIESTGPITLNKTFIGTTTQIVTGINILLADGKINNSGEIVVNADGVLNTTTDFEDGVHGLQGIQAIGRETKDSNLVVENKGNITINDKTTGNNDLYIAGIEAWDADVNNSGNIKITSAGGDAEKEIYGIDNEENDYGSKVKNTGNIDITASNLNGSIVGISGSNIDNSGNINISTDVKSNLESSKYNVIAGIETYNRIGTDDININNTGDISIQSNDNDSFNNFGEYGILVEILRTEENNAKGKIYNSGDITLGSGAGIFVNNCENDYTVQFKPINIEVINDGNITISKNGVALEGRGKGVSILNKGNLILNGENSVGMLKETNSSQINEGNIKVSGKNSYGMQMTTFGKTFDSDFINRGTIEINDDSSSGIYIDGINRTELEIKKRVAGINEKNIIVKNDYFNFPNEGIEEAIKKSAKGMYVIGEGASIINESKGIIEVSGSSIGMVADSKGEAINKGNIILKESIASAGEYMTAMGMFTNGGTVINEGNIFAAGNVLDTNVMVAYNGGKAINAGDIQINAKDTEVMTAEGINSVAKNEKNITIVGEETIGMRAGKKGRLENHGTINVDGKGAYGMIAYDNGSIAINQKGAIINVGAEASGAMLADEGGRIENYGIINIDKDNKRLEDIEENKNSIENKNGAEIIFKAAMEIMNGGTAYNEGEIKTTGDLNIKVKDNSAYIIGTNANGSYGKISAKKVTIDGNVEVSANIAKDGYKDSYTLDDTVSGKTELGENYKLSSSSLLYDAVSKIDKEGNLDAELVRNDTDISDLTSKEVSKVAGIFDKAMKDETLSKEDKAVLDKVFDSTSSKEGTDRAVKEVTGYNVYSNIARQIFDTKDMFVSYDKSIINNLGDYNFNFNFIGNYADVDSKNGIAGYDSKVTGINGAVRFTDSLYGVIGYGYNDIDYDGSSDGTIETIHTGIYKGIKSQYGDIRTGIFGEYNFHETNREVLNEKADSDFNSYLVGANVEISKKFGDDLYIKPTLSFDLSYGEYEDFREDGGANVKFEKQDYISAVPAIELKLGKEFETTEVYGAVKYSYELGDLNKEQRIEFLNGKASIQTDNIENAQTDVKAGINLHIKNISVNAELGKEFGKRDREYVKAGFSYTF